MDDVNITAIVMRRRTTIFWLLMIDRTGSVSHLIRQDANSVACKAAIEADGTQSSNDFLEMSQLVGCVTLPRPACESPPATNRSLSNQEDQN